MKTIERGREGWYDALELVDPPDDLRIGGTLRRESITFRIVSIAKTIKPLEPRGIVVLLGAA